MNLTFNEWVVTEVTSSIPIPFSFINESDVHLYVDGVELVQGVDYVITTPSTIEATTAPPSGSTVLIRRETNATTKAVDFQSGAMLTESDLDTAFDQVFNLAQETKDVAIHDFNEATDAFNAVGEFLPEINTVADDIGHGALTHIDFGDLTSTTATPRSDSVIHNVYENLANLNAVRLNKDNIDTVAGIDGNVTTVAGISTEVGIVSENLDVITIAADADNLATMNTAKVIVDSNVLDAITDNLVTLQSAGTYAAQAVQGATDAEAAEAGAAIEAAAALTHKNAAAQSAWASNADAILSQTQAGISTTKATEASASAAAASASASVANASEGVATSKATSASNSLIGAQLAESGATVSMNTAISEAATATTKAGEASTSAANAVVSEQNALASEQSASTSASTATTKASEANVDATTATTQAGIATTKAAEASASAASIDPAAINASISSLQTDVTANQTNIVANQTNIVTVQNNVSTVQSDVTTLQSTIGNIASSNALNMTYGKNISQVAPVQLDADGRVSDIENLYASENKKDNAPVLTAETQETNGSGAWKVNGGKYVLLNLSSKKVELFDVDDTLLYTYALPSHSYNDGQARNQNPHNPNQILLTTYNGWIVTFTVDTDANTMTCVEQNLNSSYLYGAVTPAFDHTEGSNIGLLSHTNAASGSYPNNFVYLTPFTWESNGMLTFGTSTQLYGFRGDNADFGEEMCYIPNTEASFFTMFTGYNTTYSSSDYYPRVVTVNPDLSLTLGPIPTGSNSDNIGNSHRPFGGYSKKEYTGWKTLTPIIGCESGSHAILHSTYTSQFYYIFRIFQVDMSNGYVGWTGDYDPNEYHGSYNQLYIQGNYGDVYGGMAWQHRPYIDPMPNQTSAIKGMCLLRYMTGSYPLDHTTHVELIYMYLYVGASSPYGYNSASIESPGQTDANTIMRHYKASYDPAFYGAFSYDDHTLVYAYKTYSDYYHSIIYPAGLVAKKMYIQRGRVAGSVSTRRPDDIIGVALGAGNENESKQVMLKGGVATGFLGLTTGSFYYVQDNGSINTILTSSRLGRAMSPSTLLLDT